MAKKNEIIDARVGSRKKLNSDKNVRADNTALRGEKKQSQKTNKNKSGGAKMAQLNSKSKKSSAKHRVEKPVRIAFLGGLNEVGKNMTLYEYDGTMLLVDCGMSFPDQDMLGVDLVIPDFTYVEQNADKLRGIVITHGHEDHIGALAYLLKSVNIPVYASTLTVGLIKAKLREHGILNMVSLNVVNDGDRLKLGAFEVECIHVNHSIPGAFGFAIRCGAGTIVQTGDFKIDTTPIDGEIMNLSRFAEIGDEGVLCMLSDSTNAERPGFTQSERKVGESFELLFRRAENRRIIVATFASNIHRVQQIIDVAKMLGRKVALSGRSLENVVAISQELGYLKVPDGIMVDIDRLRDYPGNRMVIITTGSQGEPMSALTRMAFSDHRKVSIQPNDCVIISATPIPGNEKTVGRVINELMKLGADVLYEKMYDVHVSGHACQEELKLMLGIIKPKYFIPVHGEQKHMRKHADLALSIGINKENIHIADNGFVAEITKDCFKFAESVPAGMVYVDGYGVGDVGSVVLKDRKHLAQDGIIVVAAAVDFDAGILISGPEVSSRGFIYVREAEELMEDVRIRAFDIIEKAARGRYRDRAALKTRLRDDISRLLYERTKRSPMVMPIIMEV